MKYLIIKNYIGDKMTKAKDLYTHGSKSKRNKRKLNVMGYENIKNFSWHQGPSIEIPWKEMEVCL